MRLLSSRGILACALAIVCLPLAGCGGSAEPEPVNVQQTYTNMLTIGRAYFKYTQKNNRPPEKLDDLKSVVEPSNVNLEEISKSTNGIDFIIVWGVDYRKYPPDGMPIVIYEAQPNSEGFRFVSDTHNVTTFTEEDFKAKAKFPEGHTPAS
jgi:hypothetical protein